MDTEARICKHDEVVNYVEGHPVFKNVLDEGMLEGIKGEIEEAGDKWPKVPEIYCCLIEGTRVNLMTLERGLEFASNTTKGQVRSDFVGRLRDIGSTGTVFELAIIGALVERFGERAVTAYPSLPNGQRGEVRLNEKGMRIYFEASVISFSDADKKIFEAAYRSGGTAVGGLPGTGEGRVVQKMEEKFRRFAHDAPNVLVLSQYSCLPFHESGLSAVRDHLGKYGGKGCVGNYAGVFYFDRFTWLKYVRNRHALPAARISRCMAKNLSSAFEKMAPPQ